MQKIIITSNDHNKRIDKFLMAYYNLPFSIVMKKFRQKDVRINDQKISHNGYLLKKGDVIVTYFKKVIAKSFVHKVNKNLDLEIVYQDQNILLVNKPSEMLVSGQKGQDLKSFVLAYLSSKNQIPQNTSFTPNPIHRLDKKTTGIVIFALNYSSFVDLSKALNTNQIVKKYLGKVNGYFRKNTTLKNYLSHDEKLQKMIVSKKGKLAQLKVELVTRNNHFSLVKITLLTGRKHQIRAQMAHFGFAIVGDAKYGQASFKEKLCLCAYQIKFQNLQGHLAYLNEQVFTIKPPHYLNLSS